MHRPTSELAQSFEDFETLHSAGAGLPATHRNPATGVSVAPVDDESTSAKTPKLIQEIPLTSNPEPHTSP